MLKALIVGVSDYTSIKQKNLPFCKNDISAFNDALISGLMMDKSNVNMCGIKGSVTGTEFLNAIDKLRLNADLDDTVIFYFSGHGGSLVDGHHLVLSDTFIKTKDIIEILEKIPAKNKVIFLDCCMAGNFSIGQTATFDIDNTVEEFAGKGYAVLASSNATQYSYGHPDKPISLFTSFLCEAITDIHLIKMGQKSLYDVSKLLFFYLEIWNKKNPKKQQNPIFRANMGGTIFFEVQEYLPYSVAKIYEETKDYIIYSVEPLHNVSAKRYAVKIILKNPFSFVEISIINQEIVNKVKLADVYKDDNSRKRWQGINANIVFCYFGRDEADMINCNYLCHTTWVDEQQDKKWWYKLDGNSTLINDIHFNIHSYYENLRIFTEENTGDTDIIIEKMKLIISKLVTLAEKVIGIYNEFLNGTKTEEALVDEMKSVISMIDKYYFEETDLDIPPIELKEWYECCSNLSASIHDFTLFYNKRYLPSRTPDNRIACMNMTVSRYYNDLEALKKIEG